MSRERSRQSPMWLAVQSFRCRFPVALATTQYFSGARFDHIGVAPTACASCHLVLSSQSRLAIRPKSPCSQCHPPAWLPQREWTTDLHRGNQLPVVTMECLQPENQLRTFPQRTTGFVSLHPNTNSGSAPNGWLTTYGTTADGGVQPMLRVSHWSLVPYRWQTSKSRSVSKRRRYSSGQLRFLPQESRGGGSTGVLVLEFRATALQCDSFGPVCDVSPRQSQQAWRYWQALQRSARLSGGQL